MQTQTDSDLIAAYAHSGDQNSFAELVARHQRMVYRVCQRMLRHHQEAEDATQAVFLVMLHKANGLTRKGELTGWLYGVARNVALEALRKRGRRKEEAMLDATEVLAVEGNPDHEAALQSLDQELAGLSGVLRQAVVLRYLQGYDQAEAARQAGCSMGTLASRASRGIERLRQRLAKRGVALSGVALSGLLTSEASAAIPETLLPSILATVKTAVATTATATAASTTAAMLAKGAMKAMFIVKVKLVALVTVASLVVAGGGAIVAQEVTAERKAAERPPATQTQAAPIQAQTAAPSNIVIRIVAAGAPDRLVSELEASKSVAVSNHNTGASSDQSASLLGDDTTLWARGARVDGTNTFERYYKGVFTGRKSELTFARGVLKEGEHVIDPGRHVFRIDKAGRLSSTDPDIVIESQTVNLKAYRIEFMCVDGNKSGPPETRLLGRPLNVDELRPGFNPAAAKFDASNAVNTLRPPYLPEIAVSPFGRFLISEPTSS